MVSKLAFENMGYLSLFYAIYSGGITRGLAYFKNSLQSKVIARPGTLGFMGGAFNPGTLLYESDIY
jgi:hypothetical protein